MYLVQPAMDITDSSGTPGAATINKPAGICSFGAGTASFVVTNNLVTASSIVMAQLQTNDTTLTFIKSVICGSGSFTITGNANATATTKVAWAIKHM